jgi:hypothetical protein
VNCQKSSPPLAGLALPEQPEVCQRDAGVHTRDKDQKKLHGANHLEAGSSLGKDQGDQTENEGQANSSLALFFHGASLEVVIDS